MPLPRRRLLASSGLAFTGLLAGCSGNDGGDEDGSGATATRTPTATPTPTPTATPADSDRDGDAPPGADVLGGPDDLRSAPTVEGLTLDADRGAGQFVFTPAVVHVEPGATVTWELDGGTHSVTAYHEANDRPHRVPAGAAAYDSGVLEAGSTFERTFETPGVHNYFCTPHEGLGMVGVVVVEASRDGPGTTAPSNLSGQAARNLSRLLGLIGLGGDVAASGYDWIDATWDSYWYSLYNMSTNIAMSGNGVRFPHNEQQRAALDERLPAMLANADVDRPPIAGPNLNMAAFTEGDPHFTQKPVLSGDDGRPVADTLTWDASKSSKVVSPSSLAWTHLKGVTWAKNFESHFDVLPERIAARFRAQLLTTLAQIGVNAALVAGGPEGNGALTEGGSLELVSEFAPGTGEVVDATARPNHYSAMLWFLSDLTSLAANGWFGYVNPEPLVPAAKIQQLTDGMARTTMDRFSPADVVEAGSTRDLGQMLGAVGWYGTHAGSDDLRSRAADYANRLALLVEENRAAGGRIANGTGNQAATQGAVGQGLLWASEVEGVTQSGLAADVLGYLVADLWDADAGIFASGRDATTHLITARDAGDITGGVNAAEALLNVDVDLRSRYASFFDQTFNRGRLQRAERPNSRDESAEYSLPLPPNAGGEFGQAAVYNAAVEYDASSDEWTVENDRFVTADALYLANQDIWISQWGGSFFGGRGVPGRNDSPPG